MDTSATQGRFRTLQVSRECKPEPRYRGAFNTNVNRGMSREGRVRRVRGRVAAGLPQGAPRANEPATMTPAGSPQLRPTIGSAPWNDSDTRGNTGNATELEKRECCPMLPGRAQWRRLRSSRNGAGHGAGSRRAGASRRPRRTTPSAAPARKIRSIKWRESAASQRSCYISNACCAQKWDERR